MEVLIYSLLVILLRLNQEHLFKEISILRTQFLICHHNETIFLKEKVNEFTTFKAIKILLLEIVLTIFIEIH